jgi:hypothetical protein
MPRKAPGQFYSRVPQRPPRVLIVGDLDLETFAHLALTSGLEPGQAYRARSPDYAARKQQQWASRGIKGHIVTYRGNSLESESHNATRPYSASGLDSV